MFLPFWNTQIYCNVLDIRWEVVSYRRALVGNQGFLEGSINEALSVFKISSLPPSENVEHLGKRDLECFSYVFQIDSLEEKLSQCRETLEEVDFKLRRKELTTEGRYCWEFQEYIDCFTELQTSVAHANCC